MGWIHVLLSRCAGLFGSRKEKDEELDEELRSHIEMATEEHHRHGLSTEEARARALREFGSVTQWKEIYREQRGLPFIETMIHDARYALRRLRKAPGFTITAVATLALGIGATTAIFTLVQQVMLKSLPVAQPGELWRFGNEIHCCEWGGYTQDPEFSIFSWQLYRYFREHTPAFAELAAFQAGTPDFGVRRAGSTHPAEAHVGQFVSGNFFETFGIAPWIGRVFGDSDDRPGAAPVAVMSYRVWKQKYGSDPSVVGASFQIDGQAVTVVGVGTPGFYGAMQSSWANPDFWMPLSDEPLLMGSSSMLHQANENWLDVIGRVRNGTDPETLGAQLRVELRQWQLGHLAQMTSQEKQFLPKEQFYLTPGGSGIAQLQSDYRDDLRLLMIVAGCVLLIACANLANLLLARGLRDQPQIAVRAALGASRSRLIRKSLMESLILGLLGGAAGIGIAYAGASLILHLAFAGPDSWVPISAAPSWTILLFALALSLMTGVLFGIAPAWMASHAEPIDAMRGANRSTQGDHSWTRKVLIVVQTAVSLVLLSTAGLLGLSLRNLESQNFGFQAKGRYIAYIDPSMAGYKPADLERFYQQLLLRLRSIPGVRAVSAALDAPMGGNNWNGSVRIEGQPTQHAGEELYPFWNRITPGFFDSIENRIVMGRPFTDEDTASSRRVAIVNGAFAQAFFKGKNPLGQHFGRGDNPAHAGDYEIVGVSANARLGTWDPTGPIKPAYYLPESQFVNFGGPEEDVDENRSHNLLNLILWAPGNPQGLEAQVRKALDQINPNLPLNSFSSYQEVLDQQFDQQHLIAELVSLFGFLALVLAAVGLYGVTAYSVEHRTSELGIRMALGSTRQSVIAMVLRSAFSQVGIGLLIGIPAAIFAGRLMAAELFGTTSYNPAVLGAVAAVMLAAAFVAAWMPARRAASVDPMRSLRAE